MRGTVTRSSDSVLDAPPIQLPKQSAIAHLVFRPKLVNNLLFYEIKSCERKFLFETEIGLSTKGKFCGLNICRDQISIE